jgi:hypothetical protein
MDQLPRICDLMVAPTQSLYDARTAARTAIYTGRYADVLRGWEAQATRFRRYLAEECAAARLSTAAGTALLELAGSEFWAFINTDAQTAIGEVSLTRSGAVPAGAIRKGHKFSRQANDTSTPSIAAAQFVATDAVYFPAGVANLRVPVEANITGPAGNYPLFIDDFYPNDVTSNDVFFDSTIQAAALFAAGGSAGVDDPWIRVIAAASYAGQFGPVNSALIAAAFAVPRVRHTAVSFDTQRAVARLFIADVSWASSPELQTQVGSQLSNKYLGWGARAEVLPIKNKKVNVTASVVLQGPQYLNDLADIQSAILAKLKSYFDDRPNFWTFTNRALRGVIAQADKRILTCTSVSVLSASGSVMSEPAAQLAGTATYATHFYLSDDAISIDFSIPA